MAQKGKNYFCSVYDFTEKKTVIHQTFFDVAKANTWLKEMSEQYPKPRYQVVRELF
jgi:hypothetical protein